MTFVLVRAGPSQADRIAQLHAESWRATYRGLVADAYLDGPVEGERRDFWRARMQLPHADRRLVVLATRDGADAGFMCAFLDGDEPWAAAGAAWTLRYLWKDPAALL